MTKKDYLRTKANPEERIMTWKSLGNNIITDSTKIYLENQIYYVNIYLSELNGAWVYCNQTCTENIDWTAAKIFDINYGEISFGYNVVNPYFTLLLTNNEVKDWINNNYPGAYSSVEEYINSSEFSSRYNSFKPYKNYNLQDKVTISEDDYRRIISVLGSPFIREDELEYTRDEICDLAIKPALEEYFHWIPATTHIEKEAGNGGDNNKWGLVKIKDEITGEEKKVWKEIESSQNSDGSFDIDFPDDSCYDVVGISLQQYGGAMNGNMLSPIYYGMEQSLYSGLSYTGLSGSYTGSKRPKTQTNSVANVITSRANAQALINYGRRVHFEGPYEANTNPHKTGMKWIRVWSNTQGVLNIWFARKTLNFNDVLHQHRTRVFDYSQACVKELFGNLRRQSKSDIPGLVDYKDWLSEAKETKEKIESEWKAMVKWAGVMRGSL